jgi:AraC-like DNA-binding protein
VNLAPERVAALDPNHGLPAQQYSRLFRAAVKEMETMRQPLPWAAGLGSEAFELMCHCVISSRTLGQALDLATRFDNLLYPMLNYKVRLHRGGTSGVARLTYHIRLQPDSSLVPAEWDRADYRETVSRTSGLMVWHAFCGWLTGLPLEAEEVRVAAPFLSEAYSAGLGQVFHCPIHYDADESAIVFDAEQLERRIVHTSDSLDEFLNNMIYHLIASEKSPASTSSAIKSLVTIDLPNGMPSFIQVATQLHMSESSLRRRLQRESTSYQALKDEVRCEVAIDRLLRDDAKIADVAEYLGFTEPSSFVRSFKSWTGQTPRAYKDNMLALNTR